MAMRPSRAAVAASAVLGVMLVACGTPGQSNNPPLPSAVTSASGAPSPTAEASVAPTASPTPTAAATPIPLSDLPVGTLAKVVVSSLNVRTEPSTSAPLVTDAAGTDLTVANGTHVLVVGSPIWNEDHWWLLVGLPDTSGLYAAPVTVGWVAAGTAAEEWLASDDAPCTQPSVTTLGTMDAIVRVGCFDDSTSIVLDAHVAALPPDAGLGGACGFEAPLPNWLLCDNINYNWVNTDGGPDWILQLHFDPARGVTETGLSGEGTIGPAIRIVGHYNDPASSSCIQGDGPTSLEAQSQRLTCAAKFVVDSVEYLS